MVTGVSRGLGLATALELTRAGYDVISTVRSADKAAQLQAAAGAACCRTAGGESTPP